MLFLSNDLLKDIRFIDSFPIIMANAKRSTKAKVANEFANKGYCSSKGIYYYGVKVHILAFKRTNTLPLPDYIGVTPASDHDLSAFRQIAPRLHGGPHPHGDLPSARPAQGRRVDPRLHQLR